MNLESITNLLFGLTIWLVIIAYFVGMYVAKYRMFKKAGRDWWSILPFVDKFVLCRITNQPLWIAFCCLIPYVSFIPSFWLYYKINQHFDSGPISGALLISFFGLGYFQLGFGDLKYSKTIVKHPLETEIF